MEGSALQIGVREVTARKVPCPDPHIGEIRPGKVAALPCVGALWLEWELVQVKPLEGHGCKGKGNRLTLHADSQCKIITCQLFLQLFEGVLTDMYGLQVCKSFIVPIIVQIQHSQGLGVVLLLFWRE